MDIVSKAETAEQFRKEVITFFDDQLERLDREKRTMRPTKKIDLATFSARRRMIESNRDFFFNLKIDGKGFGE
jgi:hypothetical protein